MKRNETLFIGFVGPEIDQSDLIFTIKDGYECWNLNKIDYEEFIEKIKIKIPPCNDNILSNYLSGESIDEHQGISKEQYKQCSWGLYIPNHTKKICVNAYNESLYLINLYSPVFLYPLFYVTDMGITRPSYNSNYNSLISMNSHTQNQAHLFKKPEFVTFFELLLEESGYGLWYKERVEKYDKEDWRIYVASQLFEGLKDYDTGKNPYEWQRESAEMGTILETLFTAGDGTNQEVIYRLSKRATILLDSVYPDIEKDIKKLYKLRSEFVHGEYFSKIAKESKKSLVEMPHLDFRILEKQREYTRWALTVYIYLNQQVKKNKNDYKEVKNVLTLLERSIIDIELRKTMLKDAKTIFNLLLASKNQ